MYLSRFRVKNYKCLADVDIPLTPIHVLIGPNDAGKTSVLEAIAALHNSSELPLPELFPKPWAGRELVFHGDSTGIVELFGEWGAAGSGEAQAAETTLGYRLAVSFPSAKPQCLVEREEVVREGSEEQIRQSAERPVTFLHDWRSGAIPRRDWPVRGGEGIVDLVTACQKYCLHPRLMALPATVDLARRLRLDADGFGLATLLQDILGHDPDLFLNLRDQFCALFPQFGKVRIESARAFERKRTNDLTETWEPGLGLAIRLETRDGQTVRAEQASDGAILMLGFLALAHLPDPPRLLLIEEPENGIYPKWLGEVIKLLKQMVYRTEGRPFPQIILTTHSPYVLSFFEPEEVTFLSRDPQKPEAGVRARPLRDAPNIRERLAGGEFYLGELWYNLSEEELFGEPAEHGGPGGLRRGED